MERRRPSGCPRFAEQGAGLVAKRNAAASVAEKFKGSKASASAKILSSKLTAENVKAVFLAAAGLPRDKVPSEVGLAVWRPCSSSCRRALGSARTPN
jgi:hypothetical protein